mmetsp:Transcript_18137/g.33752  ORF Transcript_18137/g.33752 Transcript_18137/m.33752 type:complete len:184 (-) Transcript_18137:113-664(-)
MGHLPGPFSSATVFAFSWCTFATLMNHFYPTAETPKPAEPAPSSDDTGFQFFGFGPWALVIGFLQILALCMTAIYCLGFLKKPKEEAEAGVLEEVPEPVKVPPKKETTCCAAPLGGMSKSSAKPALRRAASASDMHKEYLAKLKPEKPAPKFPTAKELHQEYLGSIHKKPAAGPAVTRSATSH